MEEYKKRFWKLNIYDWNENFNKRVGYTVKKMSQVVKSLGYSRVNIRNSENLSEGQTCKILIPGGKKRE